MAIAEIGSCSSEQTSSSYLDVETMHASHHKFVTLAIEYLNIFGKFCQENYGIINLNGTKTC